MKKARTRCSWADSHELLATYHDDEWGDPIHDDRLLFEMLNLEGAQAGLSWLTILKKREGYRKAFANFDAKKLLRFDAAKKRALLKDPGIVRHRQKIDAVVDNAKAFLAVREEFGSFDAYVWGFVDGKPLIGGGKNDSTAATALSKDLKKRGFRFVGKSTCYAFMQAAGLVDDHAPTCFKAKKRR